MENPGEIRESALVVLVPEAEPWVSMYRSRYDPSAAVGVPAHITINYPFQPGLQITAELLQALKELFGNVESFRFRLEKLARFPDDLYLEPEPDGPFVDLINRVVEPFPDSPPYLGEIETVIPHLTIAQSRHADTLARLEEELAAQSEGILPIDSLANQVSLLVNRAGVWGQERAFQLGGRSRE